jgi:hypothetical protein
MSESFKSRAVTHLRRFGGSCCADVALALDISQRRARDILDALVTDGEILVSHSYEMVTIYSVPKPVPLEHGVRWPFSQWGGL